MKIPLLGIAFLLLACSFLGEAKLNGQRIENDYPVKVLKNSCLKVTVLLPDREKGYYRSTRFDWSGIIAQVDYDNHTFFQEWQQYDGTINNGRHDPLNSGTGTGTAEEFRDPLGYDEATAGNHFLKIGVGILERAEEKPYHFAYPYKLVEPGKWTVTSTKRSISFFQNLTTDFGYAYQYEKIIVLTKNRPEIKIIHTLKNTGTKDINANPYCHNFFRLDNNFAGRDYRIEFSNPVQPIDEFGGKATIKDNYFQLNKELLDSNPVAGFIDPHLSRVFTLSNIKTRTSVTVTSDVDPGPFYLYIWKMAFCPEPMVIFNLKPGESFTWNRSYKFNKQ